MFSEIDLSTDFASSDPPNSQELKPEDDIGKNLLIKVGKKILDPQSNTNLLQHVHEKKPEIQQIAFKCIRIGRKRQSSSIDDFAKK